MNNYSAICLSGKDSTTFLQGQVTSDITKITSDRAQLSACCDHKGRAIASFLIIKPSSSNDTYWLVLPSDMVEILLAHMQKYAVFSKVSFEWHPDQQVIAHLTAPKEGYQLPGSPARWISLTDTHEQTTMTNDWHWQQLQASFCLITAELSGKLIPLMLGYDQLDGISFNKGCYLGQEVIARLHFRGQLKRHLRQLALNANARIGGTIDNAQQQAVGLITATAIDPNGQSHALAVIQDSAMGEPLFYQGHEALLLELR